MSIEPLEGISTWERQFPKLIAVKHNHLITLDDFDSYSSRVSRISSDSPVFGGQVLKLLNPVSDQDDAPGKKYLMFALNADALEKVSGFQGSIPKLLARGIYDRQPAVVEEFLPGAKGLEFDDYLRSLDPEQRSVFYRSLTKLYADLATEGIVHVDPQGRNFAIDTNMRAGLIDFGASWVDGSDNNVLLNRAEAEVRAIAGLIEYICKENYSSGYVAGVNHLEIASRSMQHLQQFAEAASGLKAG